jgi:hypothetical protein
MVLGGPRVFKRVITGVVQAFHCSRGGIAVPSPLTLRPLRMYLVGTFPVRGALAVDHLRVCRRQFR